MTLRSCLLLIDAGVEPMQLLAVRLQRLGYRAVRVKTTEEAHQALVEPRLSVGLAVIPPDLPAASLAGALQALRRLAPGAQLPFLVTGTRPSREARDALARAGADAQIFEPVDAHTLRFQVNRLLAGPRAARSTRRVERVPSNVPVRLWIGRREKEARLYTISSRGAYLSTQAPALRNTEVQVEVELPRARVRTAARVVMTNVPGNLMRKNLPVGMGVRFESTSIETAAHLQMYTDARLRTLEL